MGVPEREWRIVDMQQTLEEGENCLYWVLHSSLWIDHIPRITNRYLFSCCS